ncbi:MAG: hypothetical protein ABIJ61_08820 [bacterium]
MKEFDNISSLLPLLVSGKLEAAEADMLRRQVSASPELQKELAFLEGMQTVWSQMPLYDRSAHPEPELLDRFARGKLDEFSPEYSELSAHLQNCQGCREDVKLLRQVQQDLPDQVPATANIIPVPWSQRAFSLVLRPGWATATAASLVLLLLVSFTAFRPLGDQNLLQIIQLQPQFESRNFTSDQQVREYEFHLRDGSRRIAFEFVTDRLAIKNYSYAISLTPKYGAPVSLDNAQVNCSQTERSNKCVITVTDSQVMALLHEGGSFAISIRETLPADAGIKPATYEYYFRVLTP